MNDHMRTDYEHLSVDIDNGVVEVVLDRPEVRNAFTFQMLDDFDNVLDEAMADDEVRVVTLRGAGKVFSAGHDLQEVAQNVRDSNHVKGDRANESPGMRRAWYFNKPLLAGVHGYVGPEMQIILAAFDFVIAAEGTRFGYEQQRMAAGGAPGNALAFLLPMRVWKKLAMMGGWMDAEQALAFQVVQRVVAEDEVESELRRWAQELCKCSADGIQNAKRTIHRAYELMGLVNISAVQNHVFGTYRPEQWDTLTSDLKASLQARRDEYDDDINRV